MINDDIFDGKLHPLPGPVPESQPVPSDDLRDWLSEVVATAEAQAKAETLKRLVRERRLCSN